MKLQTLKAKAIVLVKEQQVKIKGGTNSADGSYIIMEDTFEV